MPGLKINFKMHSKYSSSSSNSSGLGVPCAADAVSCVRNRLLKFFCVESTVLWGFASFRPTWLPYPALSASQHSPISFQTLNTGPAWASLVWEGQRKSWKYKKWTRCPHPPLWNPAEASPSRAARMPPQLTTAWGSSQTRAHNFQKFSYRKGKWA